MNNQNQETQTYRKVGTEVYTSRRRKYDPDAWTRAYQQKLKIPTFTPFEIQLSEDVESEIRQARTPVVLPLEGSEGKGAKRLAGVKITSTKNPAPGQSLGYAGPAVKLESKQRFFQALLAFPILPKRVREIAPETLRVFQWHGRERGFEPVEPGGLADGYVWARISSPGIYTLIGLAADPFKQTLIAMTSIMAPMLVGMKKRDRESLLRSVEKALTNKAWFRSFGPETMQLMFQEGWMPAPDLGFGFGGFPDEPLPKPGGPPPKKPGWAGWEPGDDICPKMPILGWPERWLIHIIEPRWQFPPGVVLFPIDLGWIHQGPINIPGHSLEILIDPGSPNRLYTATANGGLWVLDDVTRYSSGSRWRALTDFNENLNVQCLAIAPSNNRVLYYADGASRLFRSEDRGVTWARTRDAAFGLANRIIVHPTDENTVYLATESGFLRSTNAGRDWDTLYDGAVTDAVMDHQNRQIIYLGVRNVGIVKTSTGGTGTRPWSTVFAWSNASMPTGTEIRLALGRQRTAATRTVVARFDQEVFVNKNGGVAATGSIGWSSKGKIGGDGYGWWCFALDVSPHDDRIILAGSQNLFRTANGEAPWNQVGGYGTMVHADFWDVTFDPTQAGVVYCANDGGVYRSTDSGSTWEYLENRLATAQLYATGINGNRAISGMYHQGIVASESLSSRYWQGIEGGGWEFARIYGDPKRPYYFYVFGVDTSGVVRALHRRRWPNATTGSSFDINWGNFGVTSIGVDPRPGSGVIICGVRDPAVLKRTTMGDSATPTWTDESISLATGEIVTGVAFAPSQPGLAYAITNQGRVFRKVDVSSSSAWTRVSTWTGRAPISLAVDPNDAQRLYAITSNAIGMLDLAGAGWSLIPGTAPDALPTDSPYIEVITHPRTSGVVIVALSIGVFITVNNGATWSNYDNGIVVGSSLPNAPIQDINWSGNLLYAVCHGRGLWRRAVTL
jgi:photosystem II stability/assembly factor-like uncharacterized protein